MAAAPTITALIPAEVHAGWPSFTLAVDGANFVPESKVFWAGHALVTKFENAKSLTAAVPADLIGAKGTAAVTVSNAGTKSANRSFTIDAAKALISSLSPESVAPGGLAFTLTIEGSDFVKNATTVKWKNTSSGATTTLAIASLTATAIKATVPNTLLRTAGTAAVTVTTTAGGTSTAATFVVEPKPVLSSISPTSAVAGNPALTLTLTGSNFIAGSKVVWKTSTKTTTITPTGFTATTITLPPATTKPLLVNAGKTNIAASVTVTTSGGTSGAKTFTIQPIKPIITSLSPAAVAPGAAQFTLTINGANFVQSASTVKWENLATRATTALAVTSSSATAIKATVPNTLVKTAGTSAITVTTTAGTSAPATFVFEPKPVLSSLSPTSAIAGNPSLTLTLNGSNFVAGAQVVWKTSAKTTKITPTEVTSTKITLPPAITAPLLVNAGKTNIIASITVTTAAGTSLAKTFTIDPGKPVITSLSPTSATAGSAPFTLTVNGYDFAAGSQVVFKGTALTTVVKKSTQLTASVPATLIQSAGAVNVAVVSNKITSSPATFTVKPVQSNITIASINPTSATAGAAGFTLTVKGTGFVVGGTSIKWAIAGGATTSLTPASYTGTTQLTVTVPGNLIVSPGTATVTASISGGTSNGVKFTINPGVPVLTNLSPNSTTAGQSSPVTVSITGVSFVSGAKANWTVISTNKTTALTTTFVSGTQLSVSVPVSLLATAGAANITVTTPAGTSNSLRFAVNPVGATACTNDGSNNAQLSGVYSFHFTQTDPTNNGEINYNAGTFTADGKGNITAGIQDSNGPYFPSASQNVSFSGTYSVGDDSRGLLTLKYPGGAVANVCIALDSINAGVAGSGRLVSDLSNPQIDSGSFSAQGSGSISPSTVAGSWAMGIEGIKLDSSNGNQTRGATAGYLTLDGTNKVTAGEADISQDQYSANKLTNSSKPQTAITGSYTLASTGRGTLTLNYTGAGTSNYVFYVAGANQIFLLSTDTGGKGGSAVMAGRALMRPSSISFGNGTLNGNSVFVEQAFSDTVGNTTSAQYDRRLVQAGIFTWSGSGSYTEDYDENDAGNVSTLQSASSTYSVDSSGRVTINGTSPAIFGYLVNSNEGFAVSGNLGVSAMYFEPQSTGGFNLASFSGNYSVGAIGYAFEDEKASSGEVDANGAGTLTGSLDVAGPFIGCVDCQTTKRIGASPNWGRPTPKVVSLSETYATSSSVAGRFVILNGSATVQALYLVSPDKAYAIDIGKGDSWQTLEVFNHQ